MIIKYLLYPMHSFMHWDTKLQNRSLICAHPLTRASGLWGSLGCALWEHQGGEPNSSSKGQEASARVAAEENLKEFHRLRAICQKCGMFWTKKWKNKVYSTFGF